MIHFLEQNQLLIVLAIVLVVWAGISIILFAIESKLKKAEARLDALAMNNKKN